MSIPFIVASCACFLVFCSSMVLAVGVRRLRRLDHVPPGTCYSTPRVTVIMPACNEEENIEQAVLSFLAQDYLNLEILVVNDRSVDGTALVLQRLQTIHPKLRVHTITHLPDGWMGKSHALSEGAALAAGDYLLFTDADVVLEPTTVSRAMHLMVEDQLDHLSLIFENIGGGWLLNCLILEMGLGLLFFFRPWLVRSEKSKAFMGVGAFNLVKKSAYQKVGGHASIRMHPIDDLMLGKILKRQGLQTRLPLGTRFC